MKPGPRTLGAAAVALAAALSLAPHRAARAQLPPPLPPSETEVEPPDSTEGDAGALSGDDAGVTVRALIADGATPVAVAGREVLVTAGELVRRANDAPEPVQRAWAANPALVQELMDRILGDRLLAGEARRRGLMNDPYVQAALERALVARLRAQINAQAGDGSNVTDAEIRDFYNANAYRFHIPERRRVRVIFLTARRDADRVLRLALEQRRRRPAHDFRDLARENNTDPELVRTNGEVQNITPTGDEVDPALRDAVYAIAEPGQVSPAVVPGTWRGVRGFFVVRLVGRRAPIERTLQESSEWIRQRLVLQHRVDAERRLVEQLRGRAGVSAVPADRVVRVTVGDAGAAWDGGGAR